MSPGPHQMNIGWLVLSRIRTAVRRLCGQVSGFPSGLLDQSKARVNAPISPPPARKSAEFGLLIFNMRDRWPAPNYQPELSRLSQSHQTPGLPLGSDLFLARWNKMAHACAMARQITLPGAGRMHRCRRTRYFMRPAAVSARVMTAPTSIARRRD